MAGRRAIRRWAWRLLRREWRQQALVLALLAVAVGAIVLGLGVVVNIDSSDQAVLGSANTRIDITQPGSQVGADVAAARRAFGTVEAIEHRNVPVPGSVTPVDLRAQDPHGPFSGPMLRLVSGRLPRTPGEVAMTSAVASLYDVKMGQVWRTNGHPLEVVGIVENPDNLGDAFALVPPGAITAPTSLTLLTNASGTAAGGFRPPAGSVVGIMSDGATGAQRQRDQALGVLLIATIGLIFVGLLAVAGFTVMAHRRLRALGMIGAIGATDRQVRRVLLANGAAVGTVGASTGALLGLALWFGLRPAFERVVGHRIDPVDLPWWAVIAGVALAVVTALVASWWPARSAARMPIVAALSGRPAPPQPAHRFALLGAVLAAAGFVLLVLAHTVHTALIITGILATTAGMLLLAPLGIRAVAAGAARMPVAVRLALRDLVRYQARSGAALAAASLAVGIAATIAITAAAQQESDHTLSGGNLPTNQLVVWLNGNPDGPVGGANAVAAPGQGGSPAAPSAAAIAAVRRTAESIARTIGATRAVELDVAYNLGQQAGGFPGSPQAAVVRPFSGGFMFVTEPFVATPAVLAFYGLPASSIRPGTGLVTARSNLSGALLNDGAKNMLPAAIQTSSRLPQYTSAPNTLITRHELTVLGLTSEPAGWLLQTPGPLTAAQIADARHRAAAAGISVETRSTATDTLQKLRDYATAGGLLLALGVLAMTVGLIRSETAADLRTLTATGAGGGTRRTLTAATAAALALLGGILGTATAYLALVAWHWHHVGYLGHPPYANLAVLVLGLPVAALAGGWLLGRTPATIARRPLE
jgi:putative ABC transport system permease protein